MVPRRIRREEGAIIWQDSTGCLRRAPMIEADYGILARGSHKARQRLATRDPQLGDIVGADGRLLAEVMPPLGPPFPRDSLSGPLRCYLGIEPRCNLQCVFCGPRDLHSSPRRPSEECEAFLIREIAESGAFQVQLTGGEICLRGWKLLRTLDHLAEQGLSVLISTNGVWNHIKEPAAFATELTKYPILQVKVSIEGTEAFHDSVRGQGNYREAVGTLRLLSGLGLPVRINATLLRSSCSSEQLRHLVHLAAETGAALQIIPIREAGRAAALAGQMPSREQIGEYTRLATELRHEHGISISFNFDVYDGQGQVPILDPARPVSCAAGLWGLHITHTGEVYPCGFAIEMQKDGRRPFLAGTLSAETSLLAIWRERAVFREWRTAGKSDHCRGCRHYGRACWGGCCVSAWAATGNLSGMDPYCPLGTDK